MIKPYICCHMMCSVDGKVTGDFLSRDECADAVEVYYDLNRRMKCNGFICGRVTMEESFTKGCPPDLSRFEPIRHDNGRKMDYLLDAEYMTGFYAVAIDPNGKLGWTSPFIDDEDEGYGRAQIIEVLTEQVDERYPAYLESVGIPYIFAGKNAVDFELLMFKLVRLIGCEKLLLEGGSVTNAAAQQAGIIDEISLVIAPVVGDTEGKSLFLNSNVDGLTLADSTVYDHGVVWLDYIRKDDTQ